MNPVHLSLYVVTDPILVGERRLADVCRAIFRSGVKIVQLRDKHAGTRALVEQARALKALAAEHDALLLVNDRIDVALAAGADGVHLGQDDLSVDDARRLAGPGLVVGVSVQTDQEARNAEAGGASYLAANGVFPTPTKTDIGTGIGLAGVRRLRESTALPLVAIGGIKSDNAADIVAAGADGVAVVSAVMAAADPAAACKELLHMVAEGRKRRHGG